MTPDSLDSDALENLETAERLKLEGKHSEAIAILEELVLEDPENVAAFEEIADNELSLGNDERAARAANRAVGLDESSYTGHYILGFLHSRRREWLQAVSALKRANKLKPNNAEILRCLGWALLSNEERAQGLVTLERSLNLDTENSLTLTDLGVAYLELGNRDKAKTLLHRALEIDHENARAKEALLLLEQIGKPSGADIA
jgi:Tfp pilus assembly protein PilF